MYIKFCCYLKTKFSLKYIIYIYCVCVCVCILCVCACVCACIDNVCSGGGVCVCVLY